MDKTLHRPEKPAFPTLQEQQLKKFSKINPGQILACKTCFHSYLMKGQALGPPVRGCFYGPPWTMTVQNPAGPAMSPFPNLVSDDSFCHQWRKDVT
jgi:hypothetical protein